MATAAAGCRSTATPAPAAATAAVAAWEIPADELGRQSLYRVQLAAGGERGSLRLVLRLWTPGRFELSASDTLGRVLWSLRSTGDAAFWSDRDRGGACALAGDRPIRWPRFGLTLPASDLPALLLGRLPEPPTAPAAALAGGESEIETAGGKRYRLMTAGGLPVRWSLSGGPADAALTWTREGDGGRLEATGPESFEIRWRRVSREPVTGPPPSAPRGPVAECDLADLR